MKSDPSVSIIVPVYNASLYLRQFIESVLSQSFTDVEVILVDDGSTDDSLKILHEYATKDKRIKVLTQKNAGAGAARNRGVDVSIGKYLSFADPDDVLDKDMVKACFEVAERENSDIVVFRHKKFESSTGKEIDCLPFAKSIRDVLTLGRITYSPEELATCFFTATGHAVWSKFFRRSLIYSEGIRFQELRRTNDLYFADMALLKARRITFLDRVLYCYRKGIASTTTCDDLVGMCFVGYKAIKAYLVSSGRYFRFAGDFIIKVIDSLKYELDTISDVNLRKKVCPKLIGQFLDILPLGEIVRFKGSIPPKLIAIIGGQNITDFHSFRSAAPLDDPAAFPDDNPVAIIIPVYNAYEPLCKLVDCLFKHTAPIHDVIFINDASSDERVRPFLEEVCRQHSNAKLYNNESNKGFSHNINYGASLTQRDFVILNTDTEVPDRWLPRLFAPMRTFPETTGSVTPMSTDALEFTLPYPGKGGVSFVQEFGLDRIDRAVSSVVPNPERDLAWRGLGFAMAISRRAWNVVGPFAEEVFGRGYHEESDWCFRARRQGFENRVAVNVVVPHMHNGSFSLNEKKKLLDANAPALKSRNPEAFNTDQREFFRKRADAIRAAGLQSLIEYGVGYSDREWTDVRFFTPFGDRESNVEKLSSLVLRELTSYRIDCRYATADIGTFVPVSKSEDIELASPAWIKRNGRDGWCILGQGMKGNVVFESHGAGKITFELRGRDVRALDGMERLPFYIEYMSVKVNGKEMLLGRTSVWHNKPKLFVIETKAGELIDIAVTTKPHMYARAVLKDMLLKARLPFTVKPQDINAILDALMMRALVTDVRDDKLVELQHQLRSAQRRVAAESRRADRMRQEVDELHRSQAYRMGMFITWPARKTWGGVKCLRDNGIAYTARHLVGKIVRAVGVKGVKW